MSDRPLKFRSVLFVCAANTARSVMAEYLLKRELARRGLGGLVTVRSAGIAPYARDGAMISLETRLALRELGVELPETTRSVDLKRHPELLDSSDLVLAMTDEQLEELKRKFPSARRLPVYTIRSFVGESGDIDDPSTGGPESFSHCRDEILRLTPCVVERLFG